MKKTHYLQYNNILNLIFLIAFLIYASGIFFIKNTYLLVSILAINTILIIALKIPLRETIYNIYQYSFIVTITFIFNILFGYFKDAFLISFKLILVCNIGFIFSYSMGFSNIILALEKLFTPLKFFKINPKDLTLMINIALTSIPLFIRNISQTLTAMEAKGLKRYSFKSLKYTCKILLFSIFKKTNEIELTLKVKNYE